MPVAEIGKIYEYNGKKYVARPSQETLGCDGCALLEEYAEKRFPCPKLIRKGVRYSCWERGERDDVIFEEAKNEKEN